MKKVMIASATAFVLVASAGMSIAGPSRDSLSGFVQTVRKAAESNGSNTFTANHTLTELTETGGPTFWVEADGERDSYDVGEGEMTTNSGNLRYGANMLLGEVAGGQVFGGLEFGIGRLSSNVGTSRASANISADAYDATLSALWVADSLFYVDGQLRYGYFDSEIRPNGGAAVDADGSGYEISVEVGRSFALPDEWTLIPQAQVMYSDIKMDDVPDRVDGGRIGSLVDGDTLTARIGLRAEHAFANNSMLYGQIDFYHTFDNATSVVFGQNTAFTERGQNTAALTLGGNVALSDHAQFYTEITSETGLGNSSGDYSFGWNIGFEVQF
ncbi:adhesin [Ruegeria sp. ANG-R]|uniref:autotransporter outer membrane beta-barrel domain-containing protein n=1 Tax=Ruegeria sp. ANG-R TaxID=1577903 RepID=UPI00057FF6BD|nr:autotransporter outer membrane beta-barrel domain-containing protein [Ruegeria sp. ANG-R]KIC39865.1 adhesin [Ruegeria sp. ANG-R]